MSSLIVILAVVLTFCMGAAAILGKRSRGGYILGIPLSLGAAYLTLGATIMVWRFGIDWRWSRQDTSFVELSWSPTAVLVPWLIALVLAVRWAYRAVGRRNGRLTLHSN